MGRTYIPKDKQAKGNGGTNAFDVNAAGTKVLGIISWFAGCNSKPIERHDREFAAKTGIPFELGAANQPCTRFTTNKREAPLHAKRIRALLANPDKMAETLEWTRDLIEKPQEANLRRLAEDWAAFLETCGGYEAI